MAIDAGDQHARLFATPGFGFGQDLDVILDPADDRIVVFIDMQNTQRGLLEKAPRLYQGRCCGREY
jgi:hypothetical protein